MGTHRTNTYHNSSANPRSQSEQVIMQPTGQDRSEAPVQTPAPNQTASTSSPQAKQFWTLWEAAAWVVFRNTAAVQRFVQARRGTWMSCMAYPEYRTEHKEIGRCLNLFQALKNGQLTAYGRNAASEGALQPIAPLEWHELVPDVDGPYRRNAAGTKIEPWLDICLKRADLEHHWRRQSEIDGRSRYSKEWFRERYAVKREQQPGLSKNELIAELQLEFHIEKNREPPVRSTIQDYVKGL